MSAPRFSWVNATSGPLPFVSIALAIVVIGLGLLAWDEFKANDDSGSVSLEPGQIIHTVMVETNISSSPPSIRVESWKLVGDGNNTARAHVVVFDPAGKVTQEGWGDSLTTTNVTDGQFTTIARPQFQSVFMWTDEAHIADEIMHASLLPGATPASDAPAFRETGQRTIAGVTVGSTSRIARSSPIHRCPSMGRAHKFRAYSSATNLSAWILAGKGFTRMPPAKPTHSPRGR